MVPSFKFTLIVWVAFIGLGLLSPALKAKKKSGLNSSFKSCHYCDNKIRPDPRSVDDKTWLPLAERDNIGGD